MDIFSQGDTLSQVLRLAIRQCSERIYGSWIGTEYNILAISDRLERIYIVNLNVGVLILSLGETILIFSLGEQGIWLGTEYSILAIALREYMLLSWLS